MTDYWKQGDKIASVIGHLENACQKVHPKEFYAAKLEQLWHQVKSINSNNELIHDFSRITLSRKKGQVGLMEVVEQQRASYDS